MERQFIIPQDMGAASPAPGVSGADWPRLIRGSTIIGATRDSVHTYDAVTGKRVSVRNDKLPQEDHPYIKSDNPKSFWATISGADYALAPFPLVEPGTGTNPDATFLEIFGFNIDNPAEEYSWKIPMDTEGVSRDGIPKSYFFGASGSIIVLKSGSYAVVPDLTTVYDLATKKMTARHPKFIPKKISGDTLLGETSDVSTNGKSLSDEDRVAAKSLKFGRDLWTGLEYRF
ncbi:MAG: hypothetical protein ACRC0L_00445, partial [Angustibacter sp.]